MNTSLVIPGHAEGVSPESSGLYLILDSGSVAARRPGMTEWMDNAFADRR